MPQPSYVTGAREPPLLDGSIAQHFREQASSHAAVEAVVSRHQHLRYTFAELHAAVEHLARALLALGIEPGDRVGLWSTACLEWIVTQYAIASINAILVPINPAYRRQELERVLNDAGIHTLIAGRAAVRDRTQNELLRSLGSPGVGHMPSLRTVVHIGPEILPGGLSWTELLARHEQVPMARLWEREALSAPAAPACIVYTSGTTGIPKGATLSHRALLNCGLLVGHQLRLGPTDRVCLPVPLHHVLGSIVGVIAALSHGSTVVLPSSAFEPSACLAAIEAERCTAVYGVPTMFIAQMEHPTFRSRDVSSLRTGVMAGAPCATDLMQRVMTQMHLPELTISFGMTETLATLHTAISDPSERRTRTVGKPLPHVECKIVAAGRGDVVSRGTAGELCTRGYGAMLGYWNDAVATATAIDADGWMHTGDVAVMDDDGYVSIQGRQKEVVIRGGEKVHPAEVEACLSSHPAVCEAHVCGVSDGQYGEELCAWIVRRDGQRVGAPEIRGHCRAALARFKVPHHIRFVKEFPRTASGKVQKHRLREMFEASMAARPAAGSQPSTSDQADWLVRSHAMFGLPSPNATPVDPGDLPAWSRRLLVHNQGMTRTLETAYAQSLRLKVLQCVEREESIARHILLMLQDRDIAVEMAMLHLFLEHLPADARELVAEQAVPFGHVLAQSRIRYRSEPVAYFAFGADDHLVEHFGIDASGVVFGRLVRLADTEARILADAIEIVGPSPAEEAPR